MTGNPRSSAQDLAATSHPTKARAGPATRHGAWARGHYLEIGASDVVALAYAAIERELATHQWGDTNDDAQAKSPVIASTMAKAEAWAAATGRR